MGITPCIAQDAAPSGGGQYEELKVNDGLKNDRSEIGRLLRDGVPEASEAKFDSYYKEYIFPQWTVAKNRADLPNLRKSLRNDFVLARDAGAFSRLLGLSLDNLTTLATSSKYFPATRYNAAVMLGDLNARYIQGGSTPEAYPKAIPILLKILNDESDVDAARFGALLGVVRHAKFNSDATSRPEMIDALIAQASQQEPPVDRSKAGHEWFRATAIEGLAAAKGDEVKKVAPVLAKIINNSAEAESVRFAAAGAMGTLNLTADSGAEPTMTVRSLAELASDAVRKEVEACEKDLEKTIDPSVLKTQLLPIRVALTGQEKSVSSPEGGLAAAASADSDQQFLKKVWKPIEEWYGKLDDKALLPAVQDPNNPAAGLGGGPMGGMGGMLGQQKTPARVATEELMAYFKLELQKMDNLLGVGGNAAK